MALLVMRFCYYIIYRNYDHLSGISNTDRNFYPSPDTFQEPFNSFVSSFFPKLHRSSYYRAHAQKKLLHRENRLQELYPRAYDKTDAEKIRSSRCLQLKHFSVPSISHEIDYDYGNGDDENSSQVSQPQDLIASVDCTDQTITGTCSSFTWEVDDSNSNGVLPSSVDDTKQQNSSVKMAMKKHSTIQRRQYTFPAYSRKKRQELTRKIEITGIHYTTLVSSMGTTSRLPKSSITAKQLAKRRSKLDKNIPIHQITSTSDSCSVSGRTTEDPYTDTFKDILPFKNESKPFYKINCMNKDESDSDSQQREINLHNNCISMSRRWVLRKYLATRLQHNSNILRQSHKQETSEKAPNPNDSMQINITPRS